MSWEFILTVLEEIKLSRKMTNLIIHGVTSVENNIKWNGSPYLFVLCLDKLSHLITHAIDVEEWNAFKVGRQGHVVSHLMFAYDLLIFGEVIISQMSCVMNILDKFCSIFGQQVSQEKTRIFFSRNVNHCKRDQLVQVSGFIETSLGKYLEVTLTRKAPKKEDDWYINDQVNSKLTVWKGRQLAFVGRVTLAKSVIKMFPIYPMMTTMIFKDWICEIHKLQWRFIWGEVGNIMHSSGIMLIDLKKKVG